MNKEPQFIPGWEFLSRVLLLCISAILAGVITWAVWATKEIRANEKLSTENATALEISILKEREWFRETMKPVTQKDLDVLKAGIARNETATVNQANKIAELTVAITKLQLYLESKKPQNQ
jgi:hypothetical protein